MTKRHLTIATRESQLALKQANWVKNRLQTVFPQLQVDVLGVTTHADKMLNVPIKEMGGKGMFVKELEEALLKGRADIAVHSMKDVPMDLPPGLILPVVCDREEPRDVFISNKFRTLIELPSFASLATSSLRRQTQVRILRPDIKFLNIRGNIDTRLKMLDAGEFDALMLAGAGLRRLDLGSRIRSYFSLDECLPACGQGALGIECRENDEGVLSLITAINHPASLAAVTAERALCRRLNGGCMVPIGAHAEVHRGVLILRGVVASDDGIRILRASLEGEEEHAESIGMRVAEELLQKGAEKILREFQSA